VVRTSHLIRRDRALCRRDILLAFLSVISCSCCSRVAARFRCHDPVSTPAGFDGQGYTPDVVRADCFEISKLQEVARYRTALERFSQLSTAQIDFTLPQLYFV